MAVGNDGDLLVWNATSVKEALTRQLPPAQVVRGGKIVAKTSVRGELLV